MRYYHLATREPTRTAGTTSACAPRRSASCLLLCKEESFCFPSKLPSSNEEGTESSPSEARTQGWSRLRLESRNMCANAPCRNHLCLHSSTARKLSPPSQGGELLLPFKTPLLKRGGDRVIAVRGEDSGVVAVVRQLANIHWSLTFQTHPEIRFNLLQHRIRHVPNHLVFKSDHCNSERVQIRAAFRIIRRSHGSGMRFPIQLDT